MSRRQREHDRAWSEAVRIHAHLMANGRLNPVLPPTPGLTPEPGEYAVGVLARSAGVALDYARYDASEVVYSVGGPPVVIGSPQFVTGYALASMMLRARLRRRARRMAAPQWRPAWLLCTVLTTRRLWCELEQPHGSCWLHFEYDAITHLTLNHYTLTLIFQQSDPLQLDGTWAPWCAAVIAHYRYGRTAATMLPTMQPTN